MKATIGPKELKEMVNKAGGLTVVAYEADVGRSTLEKLIADSYNSKLRKKTKDKIRRYFNLKDSVEFSFASTNVNGRAS